MAAEVRFIKSNSIKVRSLTLELHARLASRMTSVPTRILVITPKPMIAKWQEKLGNMPVTTKIVTPYIFQALTPEALDNNLILVDELYPDQLRRVFEKCRNDKFSFGVIEA